MTCSGLSLRGYCEPWKQGDWGRLVGVGGAVRGRRLLQWSTCRHPWEPPPGLCPCVVPSHRGPRVVCVTNITLKASHIALGIRCRSISLWGSDAVASIWLPSSRLAHSGGGVSCSAGKKAHLAQTAASHPCPVKEPGSGSSAHKPPETQPHKRPKHQNLPLGCSWIPDLQKL